MARNPLMLLLAFHLGNERYGLDCREVIEVIPLVELKPLPKAPGYVAGLFRYRGQVVPAIDLRQLLHNEPCQQLLSTRMMVVRYQPDGQPERLLGLVAERVIATFDSRDTVLVSAGVTVEEAPYLGGIADDGEGLIQCLTVACLLPESVARLLFVEAAEKT